MTRTAIRNILAAGAALALAGCGGGDEADNGVNAIDSNLMFEEANDQSALESAYNAAEPMPVANDGNAAPDLDPAGETEGGDTGGNTLDSNVAAM